MTTLSLITLTSDKIALPYKISSSFDEEPMTTSIRGYSVQQRKGTNYLNRTLELNFLGLTQDELNSLQASFDILDPYTALSLQLHRTEPYILAKPKVFGIKEHNIQLYPTLVKAFDLQATFRILK